MPHRRRPLGGALPMRRKEPAPGLITVKELVAEQLRITIKEPHREPSPVWFFLYITGQLFCCQCKNLPDYKMHLHQAVRRSRNAIGLRISLCPGQSQRAEDMKVV